MVLKARFHRSASQLHQADGLLYNRITMLTRSFCSLQLIRTLDYADCMRMTGFVPPHGKAIIWKIGEFQEVVNSLISTLRK